MILGLRLGLGLAMQARNLCERFNRLARNEYAIECQVACVQLSISPTLCAVAQQI